MRCAENGHKYHSGQVMQPNGELKKQSSESIASGIKKTLGSATQT